MPERPGHPIFTGMLVRFTVMIAVAALLSCAHGPGELPLATSSPLLVPATAAQVVHARQDLGATAVLVSIWATWCEPCKREFPGLLRLRERYQPQGFELMFVSGDVRSQRQAAREFLAEQGVTFETYVKDQDDMSFIDGLEPRWSGSLPANLLYDRSGELHRIWEGEAAMAEIESAIAALL